MATKREKEKIENQIHHLVFLIKQPDTAVNKACIRAHMKSLGTMIQEIYPLEGKAK